MRYVLRQTVPPLHRVLLVESGPRALTERFLPVLRKVCGDAVEVDLFTCLPPPQPGELPGAAGNTGVGHCYRSQDYVGGSGRRKLLRLLRANDYQGLVMLCANSPLLLRWKWALALRLPVKVLIANENADCFWLDAGHWRTAKSLLVDRFGLRGTGSLRTLGQVLLFPLVLLFLAGYAIVVHLRRSLRLLSGWRPASRAS
jgi:hypothetical protein